MSTVVEHAIHLWKRVLIGIKYFWKHSAIKVSVNVNVNGVSVNVRIITIRNKLIVSIDVDGRRLNSRWQLWRCSLIIISFVFSRATRGFSKKYDRVHLPIPENATPKKQKTHVGVTHTHIAARRNSSRRHHVRLRFFNGRTAWCFAHVKPPSRFPGRRSWWPNADVRVQLYVYQTMYTVVRTHPSL